MSLLTDILDLGLPLILSGAKSVADSYVDGATLNKDQKQALYAAYVAINVYGDDIVESSANPYDEQALVTLSDFCKDTLEEAGIVVPVIPDVLLEAPPVSSPDDVTNPQ